MTNPLSVEARLETSFGVCVLTYEPLHPHEIIASVGDNAAGAIAVFIGTTRNSFRDKVVTRLEYEAYSKIALKAMSDIIREARDNHAQFSHRSGPSNTPSLLHCVVYHRLGTVPVGQPSIVIAVSSPHRKEAFSACEFILEEVKARAQIWKREYYEGERDEDAEWKSNTAS